jgi:hypothetical protein
MLPSCDGVPALAAGLALRPLLPLLLPLPLAAVLALPLSLPAR